MDFAYEEEISHPMSQVFSTLFQDLSEVVPHLDAVERIEEVSRESLDSTRTQVVSLWQGNAGPAPAAVRPFLSAEMTRWKDHAMWDSSDHTVRWRFETCYFDSLYDCEGVHHFEELGDGRTRVRMTGSLKVHATRVPGLPRLLARSIAPRIESYLIEVVAPSVRDLPKAVQSHLDAAADA